MLTIKIKSELRKALRYVEKETGNDISDFLETVTEEYWDEHKCYQENDEFYKFSDEEIEENTIEDLWNEAENYVDFFKERK